MTRDEMIAALVDIFEDDLVFIEAVEGDSLEVLIVSEGEIKYALEAYPDTSEVISNIPVVELADEQYSVFQACGDLNYDLRGWEVN